MVAPVEGTDLKIWRGLFRSKKGARHEFEMRMRNYPLEPPEIEWLSPISHPNIEPPKPGGLGRVDLLWFMVANKWRPSTSVNTIVEGLLHVLNNPNPSEPLMHPSCLIAAMNVLEEELDALSITDKDSSKVRVLLANARRSLETGDREPAWRLIKEGAGFGKTKQRSG
jgi:ubiquitin-protein ligase